MLPVAEKIKAEVDYFKQFVKIAVASEKARNEGIDIGTRSLIRWALR